MLCLKEADMNMISNIQTESYRQKYLPIRQYHNNITMIYYKNQRYNCKIYNIHYFDNFSLWN